jgi:ribonuclease HII
VIPDRPHFNLERRLHSQGYSLVAGVDEAGRGPLAGPVSAGVAILPSDPSGDWVNLINDSKKLSAAQRETAYRHLKIEAVALSVGFSSSQEIDSMGIAPATRLAIRRALEKISSKPHHLLLDAFRIPEINLPQIAIKKGDAISLSIAAASIVAKVERDRLMAGYASTYPQYDFARNKGYGTPSHLAAIDKFGPTPVHRLTFKRVRESASGNSSDTNVVGHNAERLVATHLGFQGYRVLETNYTTRLGEIDIIASRNGTLVFIEVRARQWGAMVSPQESLTRSKQRKLIAAAQQYIQESETSWSDWRMDLAAVELDKLGQVKRLRIIENVVEE